MSELQEIYSLRGRVLGLLEDHVELAELEYGYESEKGRQRLRQRVLAALFLLSSFVFIHIALLDALVRFGVPLYAVCSGFAVIWGAVGMGFYRLSSQRDTRTGEPFEGTRYELRRSLQWIQRLFS